MQNSHGMSSSRVSVSKLSARTTRLRFRLQFDVEYRTKMSDIWIMNGGQFVRKIKKLGKARGLPVEFRKERGKGDHGTLYFGERFTIVGDQHKEIKTGTFHGMLKQLGLTLDDFE
jgi:mRNA interferase HicA